MRRRYDVLYGLGALLASPFWIIGLLRTGKWRTDWRGRFGETPPLEPDDRPTLLLHGVSVGEINATRELVARLEAPGAPPLRPVVSATTNTGFDRAVQLYGDRHPVVRFPFDFSWMVGRFLDAVQPTAVALMELEVWPNLAQECRLRGIPLVVINGRLSGPSFRHYRWVKPWVRPMFRSLAAVGAQTEEYAQRFRALGTPPERVVVTDTMKWDTAKLVDEVEGAEALGADLGIDPGRPLVVAGSTGPGEEKILIESKPEGIQLLLVPRKPERFGEVARLASGITRRTERPHGSGSPSGCSSANDLFLLDTMGELTKAYALADVAFVGRSLVPMGGSDPIEPIALGTPTLMGPRFENFSEVVAAFREGGGIRITEDPMADASELLADSEGARAMARRGREVIRGRQGATLRNVKLLSDVLGRNGSVSKMEAPEDVTDQTTRGSGGGGQGGGGGEAGQDRKPRSSRRWGRWVVALLLVYMALGYLTTTFRRVELTESFTPVTPLPRLDGELISGVFSVHTGRSHDATGTREQVAHAAAAADLDFVVIGDHPPDDRKPGWELWDPVILNGVYVEGGQELRAPEAGKILAIGADTTFKRWEGPLPTFSGFLIRNDITALIVHGRGPRGSERWIHNHTMGALGWEVLDVSEAARARLRGPWGLYHLLTLVVGFPLGLGDEALLHLQREGFDTPAVAAFDSLRMDRPFTAMAGLNVHPKVGLGPLLIPPYGPFFRTLVNHFVISGPLPEEPMGARAYLTAAIKSGDGFISMGNEPEVRGFRIGVNAEGGGALAAGADLPFRGGLYLRAGFTEDPGRKVLYRVLRNHREEAWLRGPEMEWELWRPGFYRVEVYTFSARVGDTFVRLRPWIFSNPVGLRGAGDGTLLRR